MVRITRFIMRRLPDCHTCLFVRRLIVLAYLVVGAFGLYIAATWLIMHYQYPMTVKNVSIAPPIIPGEPVSIEYVYSRPRLCEGRVTRKITGCGVWPLGTFDAMAPVTEKGQYRTLNFSIPLPNGLPYDAICKYGAYIVWKCTPLHHFSPLHQTLPAVSFIVPYPKTTEESTQNLMKRHIEAVRND